MTGLSGLYPAAVTPFLPDGSVDEVSFARLLAFFEANHCDGVVVAGTTGEGPSLAAVERRDLGRRAVGVKGSLNVILGVACDSITEARWLLDQAAKMGADAALVMPPKFFRDVPEEAILAWLIDVFEKSPLPTLYYHFPAMSGQSLGLESLRTLAAVPSFAGLKDSSGQINNLENFPMATGGKGSLFVGSDRLVVPAMKAGWAGAILALGNIVPHAFAAVLEGDPETRAALVAPIGDVIRARQDHPILTMKRFLKLIGIIDHDGVRLPLSSREPVDVELLRQIMQATVGLPSGGH